MIYKIICNHYSCIRLQYILVNITFKLTYIWVYVYIKKVSALLSYGAFICISYEMSGNLELSLLICIPFQIKYDSVIINKKGYGF